MTLHIITKRDSCQEETMSGKIKKVYTFREVVKVMETYSQNPTLSYSDLARVSGVSRQLVKFWAETFMRLGDEITKKRLDK